MQSVEVGARGQYKPIREPLARRIRRCPSEGVRSILKGARFLFALAGVRNELKARSIWSCVAPHCCQLRQSCTDGSFDDDGSHGGGPERRDREEAASWIYPMEVDAVQSPTHEQRVGDETKTEQKSRTSTVELSNPKYVAKEVAGGDRRI